MQVSFTLSDMVRNGTNLGQLLNTHALLVRLGRWSSPSFRHSPYEDAALLEYDGSYLAAAQEAGATFFKCGDWRYAPQPLGVRGDLLGLVQTSADRALSCAVKGLALGTMSLHSLRHGDTLWDSCSPALAALEMSMPGDTASTAVGQYVQCIATLQVNIMHCTALV